MAIALTPLDRSRAEPLQTQLRQSIIGAIHAGRMRPGQKMAPSRALARHLGIARNTVTAVYDELVARGYLVARPRQGCFVAAAPVTADAPPEPSGGPNWEGLMRRRPSHLLHIVKPSDWHSYEFPFIYGQVDPKLFPLNIWRACSRDTLGRAAVDWWAADRAVDDDPMLVEQIRSRILPQRGIHARPEEILITLGSQEGLFLISSLLGGPRSRVGVEAPGYPDARHIFAGDGAELVPLAMDCEGAIPARADIAVLTPDHCPSMIRMSETRRAEFLDWARREGSLIVEDDYEGELSLTGGHALKSGDVDGRVIYLGTFSKVLAPGVRLGFLVAPSPLVTQARWLRRLIHRSAPLNNQRTAAIFLAEGHYLALVRRLREAFAHRWQRITQELPRILPGFRLPDPCHGGSSVWLECPPDLDARAIAAEAARRGVLVESGDPFVAADQAGRFLRLGLCCISEDAIAPGLERLAEACAVVAGRRLDRAASANGRGSVRNMALAQAMGREW
ncbi:PLP-dependent aminotransferase family protein [Pseudogemmobacter sonorensis]|uniref:aminotransferase-like domain-containing protein n=1 Tax=Pseudogemmobacter sonorensis TaxID=2989681 RepID=UPI0036CCBD62